MATPSIKTTYSLDIETVRRIEELTRRWGVSKSEALRRAVRAAAGEGPGEGSEAIKALDELQQSLALSPSRARAWAQRARKERRAASVRSEQRRA